MAPKKRIHLRLARLRKPLREAALFMLDILYNAVVIIALVVLIRTFLISPFRVIGSSMADTLQNNEFILIDKLSYRLGTPKRGDPIVFLPPITSKYPQKFEEVLTTDPSGRASLDIRSLSAPKDTFYCRNFLIQKLWFCKDHVETGNLAYLLNTGPGGLEDGLNFHLAQKRVVGSDEIKAGSLEFDGLKNQTYLVRIYDPEGPEYFVKRIIGVPGDTVRIENGRVYLKKSGEADFTPLPEAYLNEENMGNTFFKPKEGQGDFLVPEGHYFVLGDNRTHSNDSRHWFAPIDEEATPFVRQDDISGKVLLILWPPNHLGPVPKTASED